MRTDGAYGDEGGANAVLLFFLCAGCYAVLPEVVLIFPALVGFLRLPYPFGAYDPVCGGFFLPLVRRRLPLQQEEFSARLAVVCSRHPFGQRHRMLGGAVIVLAFYPVLASLAGDAAGVPLVPAPVADNLALWLCGLAVFKFLIWDAAMAWGLHRVMRARTVW